MTAEVFCFRKTFRSSIFLEEAFHIIHMSFNLHDIKMISTWLKAIIKRISFWKTRFIFRFLKYIFNNYLVFIFAKIGIKGFKVKLKGKISVAGNSRKRTILYRVGKTSHATCSLKVIHNFSTIVTFTGVLGFQVWIFIKLIYLFYNFTESNWTQNYKYTDQTWLTDSLNWDKLATISFNSFPLRLTYIILHF